MLTKPEESCVGQKKWIYDHNLEMILQVRIDSVIWGDHEWNVYISPASEKLEIVYFKNCIVTFADLFDSKEEAKENMLREIPEVIKNCKFGISNLKAKIKLKEKKIQRLTKLLNKLT